MPLGIALNFIVNGREVLVPMVIEEPSVVAGASFMAKLARAGGGFTATTTPPEMIGQMQVLDVADLHGGPPGDPGAASRHCWPRPPTIDPVLQKLGGGPRDLEVRLIDDFAHRPVPGGAPDLRCARCHGRQRGQHRLRAAGARASKRSPAGGCTCASSPTWPTGAWRGRAAPSRWLSWLLAITPPKQVRDGIIAAWAFAAADPYRAATHNKGIMNGVDAVVIATGNDWRAIEAGAHAYAARGGRYTSLSTWGKDAQGNLVGALEMPMAVGIVGGATSVHPGAPAPRSS